MLDGRSREALFIHRYEKQLERHIGGAPNAVQHALIGRAARLALYIEMMDQRALSAGEMSERDSRQYLAWSNCLRRTLATLGLDAAPSKQPSLAELMANEADPDPEDEAA